MTGEAKTRTQSAHGRLANENETGHHGDEWLDQSFLK
jgi:hypothetical protein